MNSSALIGGNLLSSLNAVILTNETTWIYKASSSLMILATKWKNPHTHIWSIGEDFILIFLAPWRH